MIVDTLDEFVDVVISSPPSVTVASIPGIESRISSAFAVAFSFRSRDAPSGSRTFTEITPWSSSGRKPVGSVLKRAPAPTKNTASATNENADFRMKAEAPEM